MRQAIVNLSEGRRRASHPGLILQRYLVKQSDPSERRTIFEAACHAARSESLRAIYAEAFERRDCSFASDQPCRSEHLSTASRLIVGLGSENVLETGLRLHHTYGVPIIPGSALKGLASHYCHDVWGQRQNASAPEENLLFRRGWKHHSLLFGTTEDGGVITFHDAWIVPPSLTDGALRFDVMTPHRPKWQTNEAPPTDFDSKERERAEGRAKEHDPTFREVTDRRNDFLHAQYRPSAQKAADIAKTVKSLVEKLRIASETPRSTFVNLSNHPSAEWGKAQTKAAFEFAERIEEIVFPAVPPDADEEAIKAIAEKCIAQIPPETSHALVQGEFTLTVELVRRLQARGITCLAATSTRNVEDDADGRRVSTFTFVRFRAYAEPGAV